MIREALDRMALGERAVLAGVEVERVSLFGFKVGAEVLSVFQAALLLHFALHRPHAVKIAGRSAEVAHEPRELDVTGLSPAAQTEVVRGPEGERSVERLKANTVATAARIAELRREHGPALRVSGRAKARRELPEEGRNDMSEALYRVQAPPSGAPMWTAEEMVELLASASAAVRRSTRAIGLA